MYIPTLLLVQTETYTQIYSPASAMGPWRITSPPELLHWTRLQRSSKQFVLGYLLCVCVYARLCVCMCGCV